MRDRDAPPRRIVRRIAVAAAIAILAILLALWLARVPIATGYIDRALAARGVPARYRIADLGFGRQRLTDVVIGDPARPDLVADWVETQLDIGARGPGLSAVRAGRVRVRARLAGGRVSLGAVDRLLPPPSGKPFALPAIDLAVNDARIDLTTPYGDVAARLAGAGRIDDGFVGRLTLWSDRMAVGDCTASVLRGSVALHVTRAAPRLSGPLTAGTIRCPDARLAQAGATLDLALSPALDRWRGDARLALPKVAAGAIRSARLSGRIDFAGDARRTVGAFDLTSGRFAAQGVTAESAALRGRWRLVDGRPIAAGHVTLGDASLDPALRARLRSSAGAADGTPVAPLLRRAAVAAAGAAARFDAAAELALGGGGLAIVRRLVVTAATGARMTLDDGAGIAIGDTAGVRTDGVATVQGGGLPAARIALTQAAAGAPLTGEARVAPYAADGARLALAPVRFAAGAGGTVARTVLDVTGPIPGGRIERLAMPVTARLARGVLVVNPGCAPLSFATLRIGGLVMDPARVALCPTARALLRVADGRVAAGARIASPRLGGRLGSGPISLGAAMLEVGRAGITARDLSVRIGRADAATRLEFARFGARFAEGLAGMFAGGAGRIGTVPLLIGDAGGTWRFANGALTAAATATVRDAVAPARFEPLAARAVRLSLAEDVITADAVLVHPAKGAKIADVAIRHALGPGTGRTHISVPGIAFGPGFQPEELTRLTFGIVADVRGSVSGVGDIAWSPRGVTSTGTFRTRDASLAAAFGPVSGITGEIRFTDLLALESAPAQVATVGEINPGVAVRDGRIVYRTLAGNRIAVTGGRWPFAGGTLTLEPTLLDFSSTEPRRLTLRVDGMRADEFLQQFDFKNIDATGTFDGVLPMLFDDSGGRIADGRLVARAGGGGIAYVGDLSDKDLGTWGNLAFQALKSLRYRNLDIVMNGPLAGEMITEVRFAGVRQGEGAKSNFVIRRLQRLPLVFNIRIKAPFRGLLDSAASFYDPKRLIERNLPALLERQAAPPAAPIQPPASERMP